MEENPQLGYQVFWSI